MGEGQPVDERAASCRVVIKRVSGSVDNRVRADDSAAPCRRCRRVFQFGPEPPGGDFSSGG